MFLIEVDKQKYKIAQNWDEVTVEKFAGYYEILKDIPEGLRIHYLSLFDKPDKRKEIEDVTAKEAVKFYEATLQYFGNMPPEVSKHCTRASLVQVFVSYLLQLVLGALVAPDIKPTPVTKFTFKGVKYTLGEKYMQGRQYVEFAEVSEAEAEPSTLEAFYEKQDYLGASKAILEGKWGHLPFMLAVMCRPQGQDTYDEDAIDKRMHLFKELPMTVAWGVAFFLQQQSAKRFAEIPSFIRKRQAATLSRQGRRKLSNLMKRT